MGQLNIGVVGCGDAAQRVYFPEFHRMQDKARLVAVCDRVEERARTRRRRASEPKPPTRTWIDFSVTAMSTSCSISPHTTHTSSVSLAALEAGKHVYTEKPMAQSLPDATDVDRDGQRAMASNSPVPRSRCCCPPCGGGSNSSARGHRAADLCPRAGACRALCGMGLHRITPGTLRRAVDP